jgi:uncharacterized protein YigE (DUF2233 family)
MNAGMFHRDGSPVGLFVSNGREFSPLNTTNGTGNFLMKPNAPRQNRSDNKTELGPIVGVVE